ncbi:hypothetical protein GGF46_004174 [Coemansia sp. RSA 552]|nr:hypothetical protein GGF46_004174 [Coemansia sp. RSA 552]
MPDPASFQVLETTVQEPDGSVRLLEEHLARMRVSAAQLAAYYSAPVFGCKDLSLEALQAQISASTTPGLRYRLRLLLNSSGRLSVQATQAAAAPAGPPPMLVLDTQATCTDLVFVRCKTTHRQLYERAADRISAEYPAGTQVLLYNEAGLITEGNIANVAVALPDPPSGQPALCTPPLAHGLLAGTMRQHLLDTGQIREAHITVAQFRAAVRNGWSVLCMNSVRGLYPVTPALPPADPAAADPETAG